MLLSKSLLLLFALITLLASYPSNDPPGLWTLDDKDLKNTLMSSPELLDSVIRSGDYTEKLMNLLQTDRSSFRRKVLRHTSFIDWASIEPREGFNIGFKRFVDYLWDIRWYRIKQGKMTIRLKDPDFMFFNHLVMEHAQELASLPLESGNLIFNLLYNLQANVPYYFRFKQLMDILQIHLPEDLYVRSTVVAWEKAFSMRFFESTIPKDRKAVESLFLKVLELDTQHLDDLILEKLHYLMVQMKPRFRGLPGSIIQTVMTGPSESLKRKFLKNQRVPFDVTEAQVQSILEHFMNAKDDGLFRVALSRKDFRSMLTKRTRRALFHRLDLTVFSGRRMLHILLKAIGMDQRLSLDREESLELFQRCTELDAFQSLDVLFKSDKVMEHILPEELISWLYNPVFVILEIWDSHPITWIPSVLSSFLGSSYCLKAISKAQLKYFVKFSQNTIHTSGLAKFASAIRSMVRSV